MLRWNTQKNLHTTIKNMNSVLKQYIRNADRSPRGVIIAVRHDDKVGIGYACCHKDEKFDNDLGETIAFNRALSVKSVKIPNRPEIRELVDDAMINMHNRAALYFKDAKSISRCFEL